MEFLILNRYKQQNPKIESHWNNLGPVPFPEPTTVATRKQYTDLGQKVQSPQWASWPVNEEERLRHCSKRRWWALSRQKQQIAGSDHAPPSYSVQTLSLPPRSLSMGLRAWKFVESCLRVPWTYQKASTREQYNFQGIECKMWTHCFYFLHSFL